ncbi:unnamed protein product [Hydatigera taeniaeformis]|uniref:Ski_Sno domain-containing protein n=1 Tax=Hydatigena taeniaeformis TaxID=6205 RepID=A0A0R3WW96_HYDTA|nr:unnamed protein product [Hydatigera taeniaeformis]
MEPLNALTTLVRKPSAQIADISSSSQASTVLCNAFDFEVCPSVFKLYTYIRSHPLVVRHLRLVDESDEIQNHLRLLDRRLYFRTAYHYNTIGCPALTLEVLSRLPHLPPADVVRTDGRKVDLPVPDSKNSSGGAELTFFEPNEDARALVSDSDFKVVWSDEEDEEEKCGDFAEVTDSSSNLSSTIKSTTFRHSATPGNSVSNHFLQNVDDDAHFTRSFEVHFSVSASSTLVSHGSVIDSNQRLAEISKSNSVDL